MYCICFRTLQSTEYDSGFWREWHKSYIYIYKRRYEVAIFSKYISKLHQVDSVEEGFKLLLDEYGNFDSSHKPYIVFSDDKSVGYFDLHYDEWKNKFITYNAGIAGRINEFMDKYNIQQLAKKHGFNVLDSYVISKMMIYQKICAILSLQRIYRQIQVVGKMMYMCAKMNRN